MTTADTMGILLGEDLCDLDDCELKRCMGDDV